jgi:hypothetical protein
VDDAGDTDDGSAMMVMMDGIRWCV